MGMGIQAVEHEIKAKGEVNSPLSVADGYSLFEFL